MRRGRAGLVRREARYVPGMEQIQELAFDPSEPAFLEDPYPELNRLRESARVFYDAGRERWFVTRHEDVRSCLRDKRLGRNFRHVMAPEEIGVPPLDPRWQAFWDIERGPVGFDQTRDEKQNEGSRAPRRSYKPMGHNSE